MEYICKKCLLRDMTEADRANIQQYIDRIHASERVDDSIYETRLGVCQACELLNAGTCQACGCYVELRALSKAGRCPHKKW